MVTGSFYRPYYIKENFFSFGIHIVVDPKISNNGIFAANSFPDS
jgi:hypothetical protein